MINQECEQNGFAKTILVMVLLLSPTLVWAYVGPGSGLSAIGALFAILATIFFAIVGFVWYPIKRIIRFIKQKKNNNPGDNSGDRKN